VKALILNGFGANEAALDAVAGVISSELQEEGWQAREIVLRDADIAECSGCYGCWIKTPGVCVIDDFGRAVVEEMIGSNLVIFTSRITFGGYSKELKVALDRSIPLIQPFFMKVGGEVHHRPRYARYPSMLAVGVLGSGDNDEADVFERLVKRNAVNYHSPLHTAVIVAEGPRDDEVAAAIRKGLAEVGVVK
jgi:multimeric flavodoxin WrbA